MSDHQPEQVLADFGVLCEAIREFREQGAEVLLCGDLYAHLPASSDYWELGGEATNVCPQLMQGRQLREAVAPNNAGCLLQAIAATNDCVITTGRGKGDNGEGSCVGSFGRHRPSRPNHVLMTPFLYECLVRVEIQHRVQGSDHKPLNLCLKCVAKGVDLRTRAEGIAVGE